jgi:hypothetical protein
MRLRFTHPRPGRQPAPVGSGPGAGLSLRRGLAAALVLTAIMGRAVPCRAAGLVIEAPTFTATPGSSGTFDVLLLNTNPAGGDSFNVAADSLGLSLSGPLSVTFTDVSISTVTPYIYVTSGTTQGGGPLSLDTFPNAQFTASDSEFGPLGFRTVNPGDVFGLAHVSYSVSSTTGNGTDTIMIAAAPTTSLSDENGNSLPFAITNGLIAVGVPVPEPRALTQATIAAAMIGLGYWWRRDKGAVALTRSGRIRPRQERGDQAEQGALVH